MAVEIGKLLDYCCRWHTKTSIVQLSKEEDPCIDGTSPVDRKLLQLSKLESRLAEGCRARTVWAMLNNRILSGYKPGFQREKVAPELIGIRNRYVCSVLMTNQ